MYIIKCISGACMEMMEQNFTDNTMLKFTQIINHKVLKKVQSLGYMRQKSLVFGSWQQVRIILWYKNAKKKQKKKTNMRINDETKLFSDNAVFKEYGNRTDSLHNLYIMKYTEKCNLLGIREVNC